MKETNIATSESRRMTEELVVDISEFFKQMTVDPFVAIAAITIYENQLFIENIFDIKVGITDTIVHIRETDINDEEIEELLSNLKEFIEKIKEKAKQQAFYPPRNYIIPPDIYFINALEIIKHKFLTKVANITSSV